MKLAAIYNVFDGEELLEGSINQIREHVDIVICVSQTVSNYGEHYQGGFDECDRLTKNRLVDYHIIKNKRNDHSPQCHEKIKRNKGLDKAKNLGCTHFIMMDCDEYYVSKDFKLMKEYDIDCVHPIYTYFKDPTLRLQPIEEYFVPGICTLKENTQVGNFAQKYLCDPTRKPNHKLSLSGVFMHHYSYVRKNINRKINNSSAKSNIIAKNNVLRNDLKLAKPGYYSNFYERNIILVENIFSIEI